MIVAGVQGTERGTVPLGLARGLGAVRVAIAPAGRQNEGGATMIAATTLLMNNGKLAQVLYYLG